MMKIFEPITINKLEVKNRLVVSAMLSGYARDGRLNERVYSYYEQKAKGGWGLIITGDYEIAPFAGAESGTMPGIFSDDVIEENRILTDRIHRAGGKIACQIYHAGRLAVPRAAGGRKLVAPSSIKEPALYHFPQYETPNELTVEEIHEIIQAFAEGARRVKEAGFDAVEVHGASSYLLEQFCSPFSNKRTDEYGGSTYRRAKFSCQVIKAMREKVGPDFPILYRMGANEMLPGGMGLGIEEAKTIAMLLEQAGVDLLHITQGIVYKKTNITPPYNRMDKGSYINNAAEIKKVVSVPVIGVGGHVNDPWLAEEIIVSKKADMVTMARASLADPELPNKAQAGEFDDIIQCVACEQGCHGLQNKGGVRCILNPLTAHEDEYDLSKVEEPKNILVAGGGVSGLEFAYVAATKGHHVTVYEKDNKLGGLWNAASIPIGKADFGNFVAWQQRQLHKLNVEIKKGVTVTKELVEEMKPDLVIVATGSKPLVPRIKGLDQINFVLAEDVLSGKVLCGPRAVVIGGGLVGAETAQYLSAVMRCKMSVIERLPLIAQEGGMLNPILELRSNLEELGVDIYTNSNVTEVSEHSVTFIQGEETTILENIDTIILAVGYRSENALIGELDGISCQTIAIGDALKVKDGHHNILEGFETAVNL